MIDALFQLSPFLYRCHLTIEDNWLCRPKLKATRENIKNIRKPFSFTCAHTASVDSQQLASNTFIKEKYSAWFPYDRQRLLRFNMKSWRPYIWRRPHTNVLYPIFANRMENKPSLSSKKRESRCTDIKVFIFQ